MAKYTIESEELKTEICRPAAERFRRVPNEMNVSEEELHSTG